jgi:hypothetical protein
MTKDELKARHGIGCRVEFTLSGNYNPNDPTQNREEKQVVCGRNWLCSNCQIHSDIIDESFKAGQDSKDRITPMMHAEMTEQTILIAKSEERQRILKMIDEIINVAEKERDTWKDYLTAEDISDGLMWHEENGRWEALKRLKSKINEV